MSVRKGSKLLARTATCFSASFSLHLGSLKAAGEVEQREMVTGSSEANKVQCSCSLISFSIGQISE